MGKFRVFDLIQTLDPERDHQRIVRLSSAWDFAWDTTRALELALFRTYAVPTIGGLLARTGELVCASQRRYDDTKLLIAEFVEWGYRSPRGAAALERMNAIHRRFSISNDDFLYVLSTFVVEPIRWNERFGWRPGSAKEREAGYVFWREIGGRMGITGIPGDLEALTAFNAAFEEDRFRYTAGGAAVARATRDLMLSWYLPRSLHPLGARAVYALLDEPLLEAFAFPQPTRAERRVVETAVRARSRAVRALPARRHPFLHTDRPTPSYPAGYRIGELGPAPHGAQPSDRRAGCLEPT